jgi:hypothetical protein
MSGASEDDRADSGGLATGGDEVASRVAAADETSVGLGPVDQTVIVEPIDYPETPAAWSLADTALVEVPEPRSWRETWTVAAVLIILAGSTAIAVCVVALAGLSIGDRPLTPAAQPTSAQPALPAAALPPISSEPVVPPPAAAPQPDDQAYIAIAISPSSIAERVISGYATGGTQERAETMAMTQCLTATRKSDCVLVGPGVFHGCVSYAISPHEDRWAAGVGRGRAEAIATAQKALGDGGSYIAHCSSGALN